MLLPALSGNYVIPTDQPTDHSINRQTDRMRGNGEVRLPKNVEFNQYLYSGSRTGDPGGRAEQAQRDLPAHLQRGGVCLRV